MDTLKPGSLTDAQARNLVIKSLRQARAQYRKADTQGEKLEREFDRLIKRKTRINARSLSTLSSLYADYNAVDNAIQGSLKIAYEAASLF